MKSLLESSRQKTQIHLAHEKSCGRWPRVIGVLACLGLICALAACSSGRPSQSTASSQPAQLQQATQSAPSTRTLSETNLSGKSPDELAAYIFEHHGCNNCHTLGKGGKLGFTDRGKEVGKNFEGCVSLLTSMNVIAQVKEENRTPEEKQKAAKFQQFGCTTCHQITPGKLGLTEYGTKLASLHLACTDVQKILSKQ